MIGSILIDRDAPRRVLEVFGKLQNRNNHPCVRRALRFLRARQEKDGSWYGCWGVNYIYGTSHVLRGLRAIGSIPAQTGFSVAGIGWRRTRTTMAVGAKAVLHISILKKKAKEKAQRHRPHGRLWDFAPSRNSTALAFAAGLPTCLAVRDRMAPGTRACRLALASREYFISGTTTTEDTGVTCLGHLFIVSEVASIIPPQPLKAIIDCLLWASVYLFDLTYSLNRRGTRMAGL